MYRLIIIITSLLFTSALPCGAVMDFDQLKRVYINSDKKEEMWNNIKGYLDKLDKALQDTARYNTAKREHIEALEKRLHSMRDQRERFKLMMTLEQEYSIVNFPTAMKYAKMASREAEALGDRQAFMKARLREGALLIKGGYFKECADILNGIDKADLSRANLFRYYQVSFDMHYEDGFIFPCNRGLNDPYSIAMRAIYKEMVRDFPDSTYEHTRMKMEYHFHLLDYKTAYKHALRLVATGTPGTQEYAYQLGNVGYNKMGAGEFAEAVRYLTESAMEQIKLGSKEYPVMRKLTELLTVLDKNNEAYHYSEVGMANAKNYQSMYRIYEVAQFYPLVHERMFSIINQQHSKLVAGIVVLVALALMLAASLVFIRKQMVKMQKKNQLISQMNQQLDEANNSKIHVLGKLVAQMAATKKNTGDFLKTLNRQLTVGNYTDAKEMTQKGQARNKEQNDLIDTLILSIFPQFVTQYYDLLIKPENRPENPPTDKLTPEMRLFGLIRLGITSNAQLAESLNYSLNTIKHYKTIAFNASKYTNEEFYKQLMKIHYEKTDDSKGVSTGVQPSQD